MNDAFADARRISPRVQVLPSAGSTNAELRELSVDPDAWPHLAVLLTDDQTAGRGRLDRVWTAPPGASLAISVLLRRLPGSVDARGWIPLLAGSAMAAAVAAQLPTRDVAVKWPNDVLVGGRKICGILAEATFDAVIVGSGVNTRMTPEQLPVPTATSLAIEGASVDEGRLLTDYLRGLSDGLDALIGAGDAVRSGLHAAFTARCATIGMAVQVSLPDGRMLVGTASELDPVGRLVVIADGASHTVSAGDVVHVRPAA